MLQELTVLAVHGDEEPRPHGIQHLAELVALSVAGHVDVADLRIKDASTVAIQVVDRLVNHPLVSGNGSRRDDDPVVL
jgi:hypothetical protein